MAATRAGYSPTTLPSFSTRRASTPYARAVLSEGPTAMASSRASGSWARRYLRSVGRTVLSACESWSVRRSHQSASANAAASEAGAYAAACANTTPSSCRALSRSPSSSSTFSADSTRDRTQVDIDSGLAALGGCAAAAMDRSRLAAWPMYKQDSGASGAHGQPHGLGPRQRRLQGDAQRHALPVRALGRDALVVDDPLNCHDPLDEHLGPRRAPGDVHVYGDELVDALDDGVGVEDAAGRGTGPHRDDPARLGHLQVDPLEHGHGLDRDAPGDDQEVRLSRAEPHRLGPEAGDVEPAAGRGHELDAPAGGGEGHRPEGRGAGP